MSEAVATLFPDWPQYARRIREAVTGLTADQLALCAGPAHDPIWALAAHIAGARAYWLCGIFGEPGAETTPFTEPATGLGWEDDPDHPRDGQELAWALDSTWAVLAGCLDRWTVESLGVAASRVRGETVQTHTRASVLNRLLTHEAFHAGEISQVLGANGLPAIDPWVLRSPG